MKKILLYIALLSTFPAIAQPDGRVFTIYNQPYTPLSSGTPITSQGWDDFVATVPLTFNFTLMGQTANTIYFDGDLNQGADLILGSGSNTNLIGFLTDFVDRSSFLQPHDSSLVSYKVEGASPQKVAKFEWKNAGFYGEYGASGTLNDSVNFQVWLYEGTNDVEVHFGNSSIQASYQDIFTFEKPLFGFVSNLDNNAETFDWLYYVSGTSPAKVDSIDMAGLLTSTSLGYGTWPSEGTVFKFSNAVDGIEGVQLNDYASVYPTVFNDHLFVEITKNDFTGTISLLDMNGKTVIEKKANMGKNVLSSSDIANGNYILNIQSKGESVFYKVIKN